MFHRSALMEVQWPSGRRLTISRGSTPLVQNARRGEQTKAQMQRPGHTGRKALATKKSSALMGVPAFAMSMWLPFPGFVETTPWWTRSVWSDHQKCLGIGQQFPLSPLVFQRMCSHFWSWAHHWLGFGRETDVVCFGTACIAGQLQLDRLRFGSIKRTPPEQNSLAWIDIQSTANDKQSQKNKAENQARHFQSLVQKSAWRCRTKLLRS